MHRHVVTARQRLALVAALTAAALVTLPAVAGATPAAPAALRTDHPVPPAGIRLAPAMVRYTVQAGDSLAAVAGRFGTTTVALRRANPKAATVIHPGQVLVVPDVPMPTKVPAGLPPVLKASPDRLVLVPAFVSAAREFGVPYDLLMSLAFTESGWQRSIVSGDGALGVGQLLPMTATWVARSLLGERGLDPRDPGDNIRLSARFLAYLLELNGGSQVRALAAYYQGHLAVQRGGISAGGRTYATVILANRGRFRF